MKFKLYVAVEQHHIDADGKPLSEPWDLFVEPWQYTRILQRPDLAGDMRCGEKKPPFDSMWDLLVDLTGITLYVGPDSWTWNVYCADCPDQVSEFYRSYDPHMFEPFRSRSCSAAQRRHKESFKFEECM